MDKWDGATAARDRLFSAVSEAGIARLVVLSGDVHQNRAYELHRNFDAPARSPLGVEFVATSISSGGDGRATPAISTKLREANPHLKFVNAERGYVRHTIGHDTWVADYVTIGKVSVPGQRPRVRTRFVVESGDVRLAPTQ
jgi:alkaline phosphatase D